MRGNAKSIERIAHVGDDVVDAIEDALAAGEVEEETVLGLRSSPSGRGWVRAGIRTIFAASRAFQIPALTPTLSRREREQCDHRRKPHHPSCQCFKCNRIAMRFVQ